MASTGKHSQVVMAAFAWWQERRPVGWTLEQHLDNPTINCTGSTRDKRLAETVGALAVEQLSPPPPRSNR